MTLKKIKQYYKLTKPGIIRGNLIAAIAGFLLAAEGKVDFSLLLALAVGTSLIIACGCVINNYIDKNIDKKMSRTSKRALVVGDIKDKNAIIFGTLLGVAGVLTLVLYTNYLTLAVGLVGLFFYLVMYSFFKRSSIHGTLVGSVAGAVPPVAGYTAVTNQLDLTALLLFLVLVCWQMPHFYVIAIYKLKDYKKAGIPVLPAVKGIYKTKIAILIYTILFGLAAIYLFLAGVTGYVYLILIIAIWAYWLWLSAKGFSVKDNVGWAHKMFSFSLVALLGFCLLISLNIWLP